MYSLSSDVGIMKYDVEMLIKLTLDLEARESINFGFCCMLG